jgi:hypothetical protein
MEKSCPSIASILTEFRIVAGAQFPDTTIPAWSPRHDLLTMSGKRSRP